MKKSVKKHTVMANALRVLTLLFATLLAAPLGWGWSQKGHDVTAAIAQRHLRPAAAAAVDSILHGRSMIYWANWMDNASHTPDYAYTKTWHYKNINADKTYQTMPKNPDGDVVEAIRYCIGQLADSTVEAPRKELVMRMLVHFVGDMHQPMHMGRQTDLGGNRVKVRYFGRDTNLHSIWDGSLVESAHKWSYTEWADQLDRLTPAQEALMLSGNVDYWADASHNTATVIYNETPEGKNLSYNEVARWTPVIEDAMLAGGLRLAYILNSIFDPAWDNARPLTDF